MVWRRTAQVLLWACILAALLSRAALGADLDGILEAQGEALGLDSLKEAAGEYGSAFSLGADMDLDGGLHALADAGSGQIGGIFREALGSGVKLLMIVLFCSLADGMWEREGGFDVVNMVGSLAITTVAAANVHSLIGLGRQALEEMSDFSLVLLPVLTAAAAAGGAPAAAAARQVAVGIFSSALLGLITTVLVPLVYAYIATGSGYAALGNEGLKRLGGMLRWAVTSILTVVLLAFVGYLTVSGVIAGATDALTVKAAKFAMSNMVPVVGGILADASETVLAGAGILRNAVGVFGMLTIISICLTPFLMLGVHYLVYKAVGVLAATVGSGKISWLVDSIGSAFGLIIGMTGAGTLLLLITIISGVSAGL